MGVWTVAWIWCLLIGGLPALAKRPGPKQVAPPSLDEVLTGAGWTMTPERTSTYSVGDIYSRTSNTPVIFKKDCFDAEPREGAYTSLEVVQAMKAGAKMPLGIARIKAGGMEYKQIKFAEPYLTELASLQLVPSQRCRDLVNSLEDTSDLFVIKAILSAEIKEQLCRTIDGGATVAGFGVSGSVNQECKQESEGHVVVAYRTEDWLRLMARTPRTAPARANSVVTPASASTTGSFGALAPLDMDAKLRLQACEVDAAATGVRLREARMEEARAGVLQAAGDSWQAMQADLEQCMVLSNALRVDCVRAVEGWLNEARSLVVDLPSSEESVQTDCGELHPAFEAQSIEFQADELMDAETMLRRLRTENSNPGTSGTFEVTFEADPVNADTLHVMCHVGGLVRGDTTVRIPNAGRGPCRIEGFRGTETFTATIVLTGPGTYRCFARDSGTCEHAQ